MKLFYGLVLVLMLFVSACAQQPVAQPEEQVQAEEVVEEEVVEDVVEEEVVEETETAAEEVVEEKTLGSTDVRILNGGAFDPTELAISAGDSITWFNDDEKEAVIIIFKGKAAYMNSNKMNPGEQFELEFKEAGSYQFWRNVAFSSDAATITVE